MLQVITYELLRNRQHTRLAELHLLLMNCVDYSCFRIIAFVNDTSEH